MWRATAAAQGGGSEVPLIRMTSGCLDVGRVTVTGETLGGTRFTAGRTYKRCPPKPLTLPRVVSGGGVG